MLVKCKRLAGIRLALYTHTNMRTWQNGDSSVDNGDGDGADNTHTGPTEQTSRTGRQVGEHKGCLHIRYTGSNNNNLLLSDW